MELTLAGLYEILFSGETAFIEPVQPQNAKENPYGFQMLLEELMKIISFSQEKATLQASVNPSLDESNPLFAEMNVNYPFTLHDIVNIEQNGSRLLSDLEKEASEPESEAPEKKWIENNSVSTDSIREHSVFPYFALTFTDKLEDRKTAFWRREPKDDLIAQDQILIEPEERTTFISKGVESNTPLKRFSFYGEVVTLGRPDNENPDVNFTTGYVMKDNEQAVLLSKNGGTKEPINMNWSQEMPKEERDRSIFLFPNGEEPYKNGFNVSNRENLTLNLTLGSQHQIQNFPKNFKIQKYDFFPLDTDSTIGKGKEEPKFSQTDKVLHISAGSELVEGEKQEGGGEYKKNLRMDSESSDHHEKINSYSLLKGPTSRIAHLEDGSFTRTLVDRIQKVIESQYGSGKTNNITFRMELDGGESLRLTLKDVGQRILVEIRTESEALASFIDNGRYEIMRALEEKNMPVTIYVNSESRENEKRDQRERLKRYERDKDTEDFEEKIRSVI